MSVLDFVIAFLWFVPAYVVAGVLSAIFATAKSPTPWRGKDFSELKPWLVGLLRRGYAEGYVLFAHKKSGQSLRIRKYIGEKGHYGLELCFPKTAWSTAYWPKVQAYCVDAGLPYRVETEVLDGSAGEFFLIDCKQDTDRTYDLALTIWTKFFELSTSGWFEREGDGISVYDELIDSPDHTRLSEDEVQKHRWRKTEKNLQQHIGISPVGVFYISGLLMLGLIAIIGLPLATLTSVGDPADWSLDAGGLTVGGSITSLIFFLLYMSTWVAMRSFINRMKNIRNSRSLYTRIYRVGLSFVMIVLPIAVVLVWTGA